MSSTAPHYPLPYPRSTGRLAVLREDPAALFVYGSLTFPEILTVLLGRVPASEPAVVEGWRVVSIPGVSYPALVPGAGTAAGQLLLDLQPEEWRVIDAYENDMYELRLVATSVPAHTAVAYVCTTNDGTDDAEWDRDRFAANELSTFAERCARWRQEAFSAS